MIVTDETWERGYPLLLENISSVFGEDFSHLTQTQEAILNGLIGDRIEARGGDPGLVTQDEIEGCRDMLYQEFTMASVTP
jgi:hypothetical protein